MVSIMRIKCLDCEFSICKLNEMPKLHQLKEFSFLSKTDEEISLVCRSEDVSEDAAAIEDGWKGYKIEGILDFSLIGILAQISKILAACEIGIFVVSTYNTDYILVKKENCQRASEALKKAGYTII